MQKYYNVINFFCVELCTNKNNWICITLKGAVGILKHCVPLSPQCYYSKSRRDKPGIGSWMDPLYFWPKLWRGGGYYCGLQYTICSTSYLWILIQFNSCWLFSALFIVQQFLKSSSLKQLEKHLTSKTTHLVFPIYFSFFHQSAFGIGKKSNCNYRLSYSHSFCVFWYPIN